MARLFRILSIDGGGIRGIIPAQILVNVESRIKVLTGDPDARIADYFDLIAGTSTGGILAAIYLCPQDPGSGRPQFSAQAAVELYMDHGDEIFRTSVWHSVKSAGGMTDEKYPAEPLERLMEDRLEQLKLSDLLRPCLITAYDIENRSAHFFTQHDARERASHDFLVRDAARATSAAPSYFECAKIRSATDVPYVLVDGGVFANNPALCAYAEARTKMPGNPTAKQMAILSLGTGAVTMPYPYDQARDWGGIGWIRPVLDIMMSGVSETVDYQLSRMFDAVDARRQYLRIQCPLKGANGEMDNATGDNLRELRDIGQKTAEDYAIALEEFLGLLLDRSDDPIANVAGYPD